jgi:hypothetical protein
VQASKGGHALSYSIAENLRILYDVIYRIINRVMQPPTAPMIGSFSERDLDRSLEELEGRVWNQFDSDDDTFVVRTCYALRKKPLRDLTDMELRVGISQPPLETSWPYLVPIALSRLAKDPLLEATYYEGDLLKAVLDVPPRYWQGREDQQQLVLTLARASIEHPATVAETGTAQGDLGLSRALDRFARSLSAS